MARTSKKNAYQTNGNITDVLKELWQAAVNLRGSIEPSDYKRYVLPLRSIPGSRSTDVLLLCLLSGEVRVKV